MGAAAFGLARVFFRRTFTIAASTMFLMCEA
jgi:hypothetical protein